MSKTVNYLNRDFESLKQDLLEYVRLAYPDVYNDFSEASVGMMFLELAAYVGDVLSFHTDKRFNELFLKTATQRESLLRLADNLGYKVKGKRPSTTLLDLEIEVPVSGDTFNSDYAITIQKGFQAQAKNGTIFEVLEDVNFNSDISFNGTKNREVIPTIDASGNITSYTLRKRVLSTAGKSVASTLQVTSENAVPYMTWTLSDPSVIEILNVVDSATSTVPDNEFDWSSEDDSWYEVDSLGTGSIFVDTSTGQTDGNRTGYWKPITKRFVSSYDSLGNLSLTFGAGVQSFDLYSEFLSSGLTSLERQKLLSNSSLGVIPLPGTYLHIRYRTGGGLASNVATGTITKVMAYNVSNVPGGGSVDTGTLLEVQRSLSVNNPIPAIGGSDEVSNDEIRYYASSNFSAQERVVTLDDYRVRSLQLPPQYGSVFRVHAENDRSTFITKLYVLTRDENGKLKNTGNELVKRNLAMYLEKYRLLNDIVEIYDGRILNIGIEFTVLVENGLNKQEVVYNCIRVLADHFKLDSWQMNQPIYLSQLVDLLRSVRGVINVAELSVVNKHGGDYSRDILPNVILSGKIDLSRGGKNVIIPTNNTIPSSPTSMFEVKYVDRDIIGRAL